MKPCCGRLFATIVSATLAVLLSGCTGIRPDPILRPGPGVDFDAVHVQAFRENQDRVLVELYQSAGLSAAPNDAAGWAKVINAGMDYADQRCEAYMHALFRLNRDKNTAVAQIGLVGTATAGVLGAVAATAREVAITAILFGLGSASVDNYGSNLLYDLDPSSVRTLVKGLQAAYKTAYFADPGYDSRSAAFRVMRGYAALCVPANIEAEVNLAIKKSVPVAAVGNAVKGEPPVATHSEVVAISAPAATSAQATVLKERVDNLLDRIGSLKGAAALALSSIMPFTTATDFAAFAKHMDPRDLRFTQEKAAVEFAKAWFILTAKTDDSVAKWEQVLGHLR